MARKIPTVKTFNRYKNGNLAETLQFLLDEVLAGKIVGIDFVAKYDEYQFLMGIAGDAIEHPADMHRPTVKMLEGLEEYIDKSEKVIDYNLT